MKWTRKFTRNYKPTDSEIESLCDLWNDPLPASCLEAHRSLAGYATEGLGAPFPIEFHDGLESEDVITRFLTVGEIASQLPRIDYLKEFAVHFELDLDYVDPASLFPFADCLGGGVYLAVGSVHSNSVYYADNGDFGIARVCDSIDDFLVLAGIEFVPVRGGG